MISATMPRAILVAVVALRLLLDMGTPLMPGAFSFDPAESIEAHRTHAAGSGAQNVARPAALSRIASVDVVVPAPDISVRTAPIARWPRFHRVLSRSAPDRGPEASDDH